MNYIKKIREKYDSVRAWFTREAWLRRKAKRGLIKRYDYLLQVEGIMEEYITSTIISGGSQEFVMKSRQELVKKQGEIKGMETMLEFLKTI